ncbi:unnamed protein product [Coregonus sp. 'balchen']|nr:unnamed protein product [Coregonus sp. 'balchen']
MVVGDENRSSLLGLGAVEPLPHLISHEDKLVHPNAFMALGVIAANNVKKNSESIYILVQDLTSRVAVRELNGVPPLLELRSEIPVIQQLDLRTLASVTTDNDIQVTFREEQGFDRMLEFLCNKVFSDLHVEALQVVSICLEDRDSLQLIHECLMSEAEGDEGLVQQLHHMIPGAVAHAAVVLTNMAKQEFLRGSILSSDGRTPGATALRNAGGFVPLVKLLRSNHNLCANDEPIAVEMCKLRLVLARGY